VHALNIIRFEGRESLPKTVYFGLAVFLHPKGVIHHSLVWCPINSLAMITDVFALGKAAKECAYLSVFASLANAVQHKKSHNPLGRSIFYSSAVLSRNNDTQHRFFRDALRILQNMLRQCSSYLADTTLGSFLNAQHCKISKYVRLDLCILQDAENSEIRILYFRVPGSQTMVSFQVWR